MQDDNSRMGREHQEMDKKQLDQDLGGQETARAGDPVRHTFTRKKKAVNENECSPLPPVTMVS